MRRILSFSSVSAAFFLPLSNSYACKCVPEFDNKAVEWIEKADVIFSGKVITETRDSYNRIYGFIVRNVWKGKLNDIVTVYTGSHSCGFGFRKEGEYIVYATWHEGNLATNDCTGTYPYYEEKAAVLNRYFEKEAHQETRQP